MESCHIAGHGCLSPPARKLLTMTQAEWEQESVQLIQDHEQPEAPLQPQEQGSELGEA